MPTQQTKSERYAPPTNRPDLNRARDNDGINIQEQFEPVGRQAPERSTAPVRAEMKGPSDIGDLLAGLKTKTINVPSTTERMQTERMQTERMQTERMQTERMQTERKQSQINNVMSNRSSSIDAPKTRRKQKSDKNTVSLDI
jgi:hypothetical protein